MADYVLLYSGGKMPEGKEEQDAVMAAWNAWFGELGGASGTRATRSRRRPRASDPTARSAAAGGQRATERLLDRDGGLAGRGGREGQGALRCSRAAPASRSYETFAVM